jgi:hypothetical protein
MIIFLMRSEPEYCELNDSNYKKYFLANYVTTFRYTVEQRFYFTEAGCMNIELLIWAERKHETLSPNTQCI